MGSACCIGYVSRETYTDFETHNSNIDVSVWCEQGVLVVVEMHVAFCGIILSCRVLNSKPVIPNYGQKKAICTIKCAENMKYAVILDDFCHFVLFFT